MSTILLAFNKRAADEINRRLALGRGLASPTAEQEAVLDVRQGVVGVRACPGSGKTATMVELAIRLGNAEARTLHSYCLREISRQPVAFGLAGGRPKVVTDGLFKLLMEATGEEYDGWDGSPWDVDWVTIAERSVYTEELNGWAEGDAKLEESVRALTAYRKMMEGSGRITFDMMIRLVAENPDATGYPPDHVIVDEFQDLDRFQFDIVKAMGRMEPTLLTVVGDPNQRIYEWRGALEDAFETFQEAFPEAIKLPLTTNFRSHEDILELAETVCPVGMHGVRGHKDGSVVRTIDDEVAWTFITGPGEVPLEDRAILCRYNRTCAHWQLNLAREGVPVFLVGGGDFWNLRHIKIALEGRRTGMTWTEVVRSFKWQKFIGSKKFRDGEDGRKRAEEVTEDALWIHTLSEADLKTLQTCLQDEHGIKVSTIHKAKGTEYEKVLVINEKIEKEVFVWYVAVTRAKTWMMVLE